MEFFGKEGVKKGGGEREGEKRGGGEGGERLMERREEFGIFEKYVLEEDKKLFFFFLFFGKGKKWLEEIHKERVLMKKK